MKFERDYLIRRTLIIFYCVIIGFLIWRFVLPKTALFLYASPVILLGALMWLIWQMDELEINKHRTQETTNHPQSEPAHAPMKTNQDAIPPAEQIPEEQGEKKNT
jgi:hypothetical protein